MSQRKRTVIKQGAMMDVMSHLENLPVREHDPGVLLGLSEIFRTKEYMTEIKNALKKGYTFDDLAEMFSAKCGVSISGRQMKYHYTRANNLGAAKKKSGGIYKPLNISKDSRKVTIGGANTTHSGTNSSPAYSGFVSESDATGKTKLDKFSGSMEAERE